MDNIHPIFDEILQTDKKEKLLNQRGLVIWMVGLSGSGKSTLAKNLDRHLFSEGKYTILLDGDNLRVGLTKDLGFSAEERKENIRRTAEAAKLYAYNGAIVICSLISPTDNIRQMSREIIGKKYFELYVEAPLEVCEERDVKGLYAKARKGEIPNFTGIDSPFEEPTNADLVVHTADHSIDDCLKQILNVIDNKVTF